MSRLLERKTRTPHKRSLRESFVTEQIDRIDRDRGVIYGVKILGRKSRNGRLYSDKALAQAAHMYEGVVVNVDHPENKNDPNVERKMSDRWGVLRNVRLIGEGVYGDLEYLKSHKLTEELLEIAERWPNTFGLSHNAEGKVERKGGQMVVEELEEVHSVDVVQDPATNKGLFESRQYTRKRKPRGRRMITTIRESLFEAARCDPRWKKTRFWRTLREQVAQDDRIFQRMEDEDDPEADMKEPVGDREMEAGGNPGDQMNAALKAGIMAAYDDDTLDGKTTAKRVKDLIDAAAKTGAMPGSIPTAVPQPEEPAMPQQVGPATGQTAGPADEAVPPEEEPEEEEYPMPESHMHNQQTLAKKNKNKDKFDDLPLDDQYDDISEMEGDEMDYDDDYDDDDELGADEDDALLEMPEDEMDYDDEDEYDEDEDELMETESEMDAQMHPPEDEDEEEAAIESFVRDHLNLREEVERLRYKEVRGQMRKQFARLLESHGKEVTNGNINLLMATAPKMRRRVLALLPDGGVIQERRRPRYSPSAVRMYESYGNNSGGKGLAKLIG